MIIQVKNNKYGSNICMTHTKSNHVGNVQSCVNSLVIVTESFEDSQLWDCAKITEHLSCQVESYLHCSVLGDIIRVRIGRH